MGAVAWVIQVVVVPALMVTVLLYLGTQPLRLTHPESRRASRAGLVGGLGIAVLVLVARSSQLRFDDTLGHRPMQFNMLGAGVGMLLAAVTFALIVVGNRARPVKKPPDERMLLAAVAFILVVVGNRARPVKKPPNESCAADDTKRTAAASVAKRATLREKAIKLIDAAKKRRFPVVYQYRHTLRGLLALTGSSGCLLAALAYLTMSDMSDTVICAALTASTAFAFLVGVSPGALNSRATPSAIIQ